MCKHEISFDKLPQAITYLTEQVAELKQLVSELQPLPSEKHQLVGIDDACRIIQKAKPTISPLSAKGCFHPTRRAKSSTSTKISCWSGSKTVDVTPLSRTTTKF